MHECMYACMHCMHACMYVRVCACVYCVEQYFVNKYFKRQLRYPV